MLKYRLISAFILMHLVIVSLFLLPPIEFTIITLIICVLAAWEWSKLSGLTTYFERICLSIFYGLFLSPMLFLLPKYYLSMYEILFSWSLGLSLGWWIIALLLVTFYPSSARIWRNSKIVRIFFGFLIIVPFFWNVITLRFWRYNENHNNGAIWLLYVIVLVWGADSGAYFFGKLLGKHKLAPKISPKKTWQGLIGGLCTAIIISYFYQRLIICKISLLSMIFCSFLTILASVLGDLTESMFKREIGIKDSSYLIPGHGGILDCIDGLTAAVPIFGYLLLLVLRVI